jgi:MFS transporter, DHA1 family, tetracycline resistance protein
MRNATLLILFIIAIDAVGIGLALPVLPALLREVSHQTDLRWHYGAFLSLYALLQFFAAPALGALSDRLGRRPVLLISLAGAVVNYGLMAFAPSIGWLFAARAISGLTAANAAVAAAYLTDITAAEQRSRVFGRLSAAFGAGFMLGPLLGGVLGASSLRAPFAAAAALNAVSLVVGLLVLKETRCGSPEPVTLNSLNPLSSLSWAARAPLLVPLLAVFMILTMIGEIGGTIWALYGEQKFGWTTVTIGISFAAFGIFHAASQAFLTGPLSERCGEKKAFLISNACDAVGYLAMAVVTTGALAFAAIPVLCVGGISQTVLASVMTRSVSTAEQGRLQGVLAALTSIGAIIAPLAISTTYFATRSYFPGFVWVIGAALYLVTLPITARFKPVFASSLPRSE